MDLMLENIINWCNKNSLPIANGISFDKPGENVFLVDFENYVGFLNFCNSLSGAVLIYSLKFFDLKEEVKEFLEIDDDDAEALIDKVFKDYKQFDGHSSHLYLSCNYNGFTYLFIEKEEWYLKFEEESEYEKNIEISILESLKQPNLPTDRLNKIINKIASSTEFYAAHTRPSKVSVLVHQMVLEENVREFHIDLFDIERLAMKQFRAKYLKQKEQDCKEQIAILKRDGKTKKAIIAILKITEGMYDSLVVG
jgi:hypothetical protein